MAEESKHPDQHRSETLVVTSTEPVKALGVDEANPQLARVGAYAVRFSGPEEKDLAGEYFTKDTYFGSKNGDGADILFNHGEPIGKSAALKSIAEMTFGVAKALKDDIGVFIETVLDLADDYQKAIFDLVQQGKLAWSTGSATHVVKKAPDGCIKRWPIIESSFTPMPCEPRLPKITELKSVKIADDIKAEIKAAFQAPSRQVEQEVLVTIDATATAPVDNAKNVEPHNSPQTTMSEPKDETKNAPAIDLEAERKKWQRADADRKSAIRAEAKQFEATKGVKELTEAALDNGTTVEDFRKSLISQLRDNASAAPEIRVVPSEAREGKHAMPASAKSIGTAFVESDAYKNVTGKSVGAKRGVTIELPNVDVKATLLTSTGPFTNYERPPGPILLEQQRLTIRDLLAQGTTNANSLRIVQEDSYTNAATTVAEEGQKPEASWDLSEYDMPIRKIAVIGRVSDEAFDDFPFLQTYVDQRLRFMLKEREEAQLLSGSGSGNNLTGLLNTSGIQTQALGTDTRGDAIFKAIFDKVFAVGHFDADGVVMHPTDYSNLRREKDANNQYFGGGPFVGPYGNGGGAVMRTVWGLPCVVTTAISAGTALVGAFKMGAMIFDRLGVRVDTTNSDASDFQYNRIAIRVEERLGLAVFRPLAFCKVTGL